MNDLLDMDFSQVESTPSKQNASEQKEDLLANTFAKLGLDLNTESDPSQDTKKEAPDEGDVLKEDFLSLVPLPDFNTKDHKVKRILESVPNFDWLLS